MSHHDTTEHSYEHPREETVADGDRDRRTGWHTVNTGHLVMGVAFTGLVVVWALLTSDTVELEHTGWILGVPWLVAGAVGVLASVLRGRRDDRSWEHPDAQRVRGWQ